MSSTRTSTVTLMMMMMSMLIISLTLCHSVWEIWNVDIKFIIRQRRNNNTATTTSQSVSHSVGELSFTEWLMVRNLGGKRGGWLIGLIAWRPIPITRFDVDMTSRLMFYFPGVWCFVSYHPFIHRLMLAQQRCAPRVLILKYEIQNTIWMCCNNNDNHG